MILVENYQVHKKVGWRFLLSSSDGEQERPAGVSLREASRQQEKDKGRGELCSGPIAAN